MERKQSSCRHLISLVAPLMVNESDCDTDGSLLLPPRPSCSTRRVALMHYSRDAGAADYANDAAAAAAAVPLSSSWNRGGMMVR